MTRTFRAAYIADDGSSTSGGLLLTSPDQAELSDEDLFDAAIETAEAIGLEYDPSDICIGDWTD